MKRPSTTVQRKMYNSYIKKIIIKIQAHSLLHSHLLVESVFILLDCDGKLFIFMQLHLK